MFRLHAKTGTIYTLGRPSCDGLWEGYDECRSPCWGKNLPDQPDGNIHASTMSSRPCTSGLYDMVYDMRAQSEICLNVIGGDYKHQVGHPFLEHGKG